MSGFNFGQIGDVLSDFMDSDFIDIKRDSGGKLQEVYSNIPCHLSFNSTDNPDPNSVDTKPIIQSITVHCANWVDIQNNDFIVGKRMDNQGNLLKVYSGRCGNPIVSQGRQKVLMTMSATEPETPTPTPPINPAIIKIQYFSNGSPIQDEIEKTVEVGSSFTINAPAIEGYQFADCYVNGVLQESPTVFIANVDEEGYTIMFEYSVSDMPNMARFLVYGLYTTDDGDLANGWHQYKKINLDSITESEDVYTITCDNVDWVHEDNGKVLAITSGAKLVLIPRNIFVMVTRILSRVGDKVTFTAIPYTPTEDELNSYVCGWYD